MSNEIEAECSTCGLMWWKGAENPSCPVCAEKAKSNMLRKALYRIARTEIRAAGPAMEHDLACAMVLIARQAIPDWIQMKFKEDTTKSNDGDVQKYFWTEENPR